MIKTIQEFKILLRIAGILENDTPKKAVNLAKAIAKYLMLYLNFKRINYDLNLIILQKSDLIITLNTNMDKDTSSPTWCVYNRIDNKKHIFNINSEIIEYILDRHKYLESI